MFRLDGVNKMQKEAKVQKIITILSAPYEDNTPVDTSTPTSGPSSPRNDSSPFLFRSLSRASIATSETSFLITFAIVTHESS